MGVGAGGISTDIPATGFLAHGGEMGARMRGFDWSETPIGLPGTWPQALRTALRLLLGSPHPMFIWWGPGLTQFYNDAYRRALVPPLDGPPNAPSNAPPGRLGLDQATQAQCLGLPGRDCRAAAWDSLGPQVERVMAGAGASWNADRRVPVTGEGEPAVAWWSCGYSPIDDAGMPGGIGGVLAICHDVTAEHQAREALEAAARRWRTAFEHLHEGFAQCEMLYDAAGHAVDFRYLELNAAGFRLIGVAEAAIIGQLASRAIPGLEPAWTEIYAKVVETGEAVQFEHRIAALGQWFEVFAYRSGPGRFTALFLDVTARRAAEDLQRLLAREVDHRAKNALAVVQAAVRLTNGVDLPSYRRAIEGRVATLARAQTLLAANGWCGADLGTLLRGELGAFLDEAEQPRARLTGPPVVLPARAAQPLALALHELATNAIRFGALSVPAGRLAIGWQQPARPGGPLRLRWEETGGPVIEGPPGRRGFGTRVLDGTVRGQMAGTVTLDWRGSGLVCELAVPIAGRGSEA